MDDSGILTHFVAIEQDVTKRILPEDSLKKAKEEADRDRLRQVVINILSKTTKYSDPEKTVTVSGTARDNSTILLSVANQGWGLTTEQQTHLFESFNRLGEGDSGDRSGACGGQKLVEMMGGTISVESQPGHRNGRQPGIRQGQLKLTCKADFEIVFLWGHPIRPFWLVKVS